MKDWIKENYVTLHHLKGKSVQKWYGIEMAVREEGADGKPQWYDDSIPFLQLGRIDLLFSNEQRVSILDYQSDDQWGLNLRNDLSVLDLESYEDNSIFRSRELIELPLGEIESVQVSIDDTGDISDIYFKIGGHLVALKSGEVYEQMDGSLKIVYMDESVLVQVDGVRPNKAN